MEPECPKYRGKRGFLLRIVRRRPPRSGDFRGRWGIPPCMMHASEDELNVAIHEALDAGEYDRAAKLLAVLRQAVGNKLRGDGRFRRGFTGAPRVDPPRAAAACCCRHFRGGAPRARVRPTGDRLGPSRGESSATRRARPTSGAG